MVPLVRALQTCTVAAALFALIGACGLTPLSRGPRVRPRPRAPGVEVTVRSLTGHWVAVRDTAGARQVLTLSLVQSGNTVTGRLRFADRTLTSDPAQPGTLRTSGQFSLTFGQSHERLVVDARPDRSGDALFVSIRGLGPEVIALVFTRT